MSKQSSATDTSQTPISSGGDDPIILTPTSTPSPDPFPQQRSTPKHISALRTGINSSKNAIMDDKPGEQPAAADDRNDPEDAISPQAADDKVQGDSAPTTPKKKAKCQKPQHKKKLKASHKAQERRKTKDDSSDSSSDNSSSSEPEDDSDSSDESSSEKESKRKKKSAKSKRAKKNKDKKRRKSRKQDSDRDDSDTSATDKTSVSSEEEVVVLHKKKSSRKSKVVEVESDDQASPEDNDSLEMSSLKTQLKDLLAQLEDMKLKRANVKRRRSSTSKTSKSKSKSSKKGSEALDYKRVDQLWDDETHQYQLKESAEEEDNEFAEYAFLVRRCFDWENKYLNTTVDIKSKPLRDVLGEVMKGCKSVSLEALEPSIDPNLLFLYLEDLRTYYKKTLKAKIKAERKKKAIKKLETQRSLTKTLVKYIDEDYADTKKTLMPLLAAGNITFDLLWALFSPNDIAITSCYGSWDNPRCYKVDYAHKFKALGRGEYYAIEGRYLEYDGKSFGYGELDVDIDNFKGPRKITSLACFPLKYHKDSEAVKKQIIERGQKFVSMEGMQYKVHKGLAFMKKKKQVLRININGRVMIDPATFRRINPNYPISMISPRGNDDLEDDSDDDEDGCSCCACNPDSDNEDAVNDADQTLEHDGHDESESTPKYKYKWVQGDDGNEEYVAVEVDDNGDPLHRENLDKLADSYDKARTFTEEQLLLTSPVVVGFAFSEKLWLEFTLSGVHDVAYNDQAFDALVLPQDQKSTVRALVESHKFHAAKTIDDVVVGKGQGCVIVLHGKPGVGKTLTAEAISELTKSPLYTISTGELGTDPARLEAELEKILSIAHSWGAVLLLDEADVFLEKRETQDVHRNALVSVFLRQLEYCQNLLVLTTNRVETFDEAFHSRIHLALRYGDLTAKAKKTIWTTFLDKVRGVEGGVEVAAFSDADMDALARHALNGRQIKNVVRTAQALALHEHKPLTLAHVKRVLDVAETFDRDLRGGTGYVEAMRSYT